MGGISSEVNISNVHLLNDSVIDEELRPPTDVENVKFFKRSIFQILRRITHDSYMILIERNDYEVISIVNDCLNVISYGALDLSIAQIN